ncbi:MAG: pantoate--beta-alanine ligase, partial [Gammaproteobacteria bacterium]|nr:pantoate--beta-alanine ligase [Gammaproteobacteria bacterium]
TQFGPTEDIDNYPRTPAEDEAVLAQQGKTDLLFVPGIADIYPHGTDRSVSVQLPPIADELCGRSRPGHFNGVASVVLRFLNIVMPEVLVLGRKDYQQMVLISRMIHDLQIDVELISGDIVREPDGLAMSSRNRYLTTEQRAIAPELSKTLELTAEKLRSGDANFATHKDAALETLASVGFKPDYIELRNADDLSPADPTDNTRAQVLMAAAWLGRARLIDNVQV